MDKCPSCLIDGNESFLDISENGELQCKLCDYSRSIFESIPKDTVRQKEVLSEKDSERCLNCLQLGGIVENASAGEIICTKCGTIQSSRAVYDGEYWKNYSSDREEGKDNTPVSWMDPTNPYNTLGTSIKRFSFVDVVDSNGNSRKIDLSRIQHIVCSSNQEKAFYNVIKIFDKLTYNNEFTKATVDCAKNYWNEIVKSKRIFRGGNRKGILACCILYACFETNCSKTRDHIANEMLISKDDITKGEPLFKDIILKSKYKHIINKNKSVVDLFIGLINKLELPYAYVKACIDLHRRCEEDLSEISTTSAVGGVISFIVHEEQKLKKPTKKVITEAVGITNPTLSNALKIIRKAIQSDKLVEN